MTSGPRMTLASYLHGHTLFIFLENQSKQKRTIERRKKKTYKDKNTTKNDERAKVNEK